MPRRIFNRYKHSGLEGLTIAAAGPTVRAASDRFRSRIREATGVGNFARVSARSLTEYPLWLSVQR